MLKELSYSKISNWLKCEKLFFYKYIENLRPRVKSPPLGMGSIFGKAVSHRLKGEDPLPIFEAEVEEFKKQSLYLEDPSNWLSEVNRMGVLCRDLLKKFYQMTLDYEVLEIENPLFLQLPEVSLKAVPDGIVIWKGERVCLENKLRKRYRPKVWTLDLQSRIYCLVSGTIGTLYQFFLYGTMEIKEEPVFRTKTEMENTLSLIKEVSSRIKRAIEDPEYNFLPFPSPLCGRCEYSELCISEMQGGDTEYIKNTLFEVEGEEEEEKEEEEE